MKKKNILYSIRNTLESSPFIYHCQLHDFFSNLKGKKRVVRISGALIAIAAGYSNIMSAVQQDFFSGFQFKKVRISEMIDFSNHVQLLKHSFFLTRQCFLRKDLCSELLNMMIKIPQVTNQIGYSLEKVKTTC